MKILIIGGTQFLGRAITESALTSGHEVTLFNRGKTNPEIFPNAEHLIGDRKADLSALEGRKWDVCVDVCGYIPAVVKKSAYLLKDAVDHYTFISTISVYKETGSEGIDENSEVSTFDQEDVEAITPENYGPLKTMCEKAVEEIFTSRCINVRPGFIVGPHDATERFTYWPRRAAAGGDALVHNRLDAPMQIIDARDLGDWVVSAAERKLTGTFNTTGPGEKLTWKKMLDYCKQAVEGRVNWVPVDEDFLLDNGIEEYSDLPLWIAAKSNSDGMEKVDSSKAVSEGLKYRPLIETIKDILDWDKSRPSVEKKGGISPEREAEILKLWSEKQALTQ